MEGLIPLITRLYDVFHTANVPPVELPQVVVVGSQSSGKSSVLEAIVGRDFLPRGINIVTRRPLVLHLYNIGSSAPSPSPAGAASSPSALGLPPSSSLSGPSESKSRDGVGAGSSAAAGSASPSSAGPSAGSSSATAAEWGEFLHLPERRFYDFNAIRDEILADTARVAGPSKAICHIPIVLKIYSPRVLNLTMVDLPGLTKVPVGDQPSDIEKQVRELCLEYISNPTAIILAVSAANSDLANSDSLKLARSVDPEGQRTIGVLTKLDLMDSGTDAVDALQGRIIHLRHGYVGVVNRSQQDIKLNTDMAAARLKERLFFERHSAYRSMASKLGIPYLTRVLNTILVSRVRDCLPDLKSRLSGMLMDIQTELESLGDPITEQSKATQSGLLLSLLSRFSSNFCHAIDGRGSECLEMHELYGGARIAYIFQHSFSERIQEIDPFDGLTDEDICTAIQNSTGPRQALFVPEGSFELLVKRQIRRLEAPGLQCVDLVYEELQRVSYECESTEIKRFGQLREKIIDVVHGLLRRTLAPTHTMISNLIHIELAHINTNHSDFIGGARAVQEAVEREEEESRLRSADDEAGSFASSHSFEALSAGPSSEGHPSVAYPSSRYSSIDALRRSQGPTIADSVSPSHSHSHSQSNGFGPGGSRSGPSSRLNGAGAGAGAGAGSFSGSAESPRDADGVDSGDAAWAAERLAGVSLSALSAPPPPVPSGPVVKLARVPSTLRTSAISSMSRQDYMEMCIIKSLIASYFNIVRKTFLDMVPKTIMCFLVNHVKEHLQSELVRALYTDDSLDRLLTESDDVASKRRARMEQRTVLMKALSIVHEVRDFNMFK